MQGYFLNSKCQVVLESIVLPKPGRLNIFNLHSNLHLPSQCKLAGELQLCLMGEPVGWILAPQCIEALTEGEAGRGACGDSGRTWAIRVFPSEMVVS